MPSEKATTTKSTTKAAKRKASPSSGSPDNPDVSSAPGRFNKKSKPNGTATSAPTPHLNTQIEEDNDVVLRKFYPPEISTARCAAYNENRLCRPVEQLIDALRETAPARNTILVQDAVVHWFKCDLRIRDNKALYLASQKTRQTASGTPAALIGLYIISPEDFEAHLTAPVRVDFILRSLTVLRADLAALDIPLYIETVPKRRDVTARIVSLLKEWGARHLFANMEYEVDELRRETRLVRTGVEEDGIAVEVVHDTCVVAPGELCTGTGKQYSVYTPWFRAWVAHLHKHPDLLEPFEAPTKNPSGARTKFASQFDCTAPTDAPENKRLSLEEKTRFAALWPAGEHEALTRLEKFAKVRISAYQSKRDFPAEAATSSLSVHLAAGTLSARTAVWRAREQNSTRRLDGGNRGIQRWIGEVAWRDFYRHVLAHWPYVWYVVAPPFHLNCIYLQNERPY
jgi:deoxyribodipyrimidine photo-lyase